MSYRQQIVGGYCLLACPVEFDVISSIHLNHVQTSDECLYN